jgi:hypothetical protein
LTGEEADAYRIEFDVVSAAVAVGSRARFFVGAPPRTPAGQSNED